MNPGHAQRMVASRQEDLCRSARASALGRSRMTTPAGDGAGAEDRIGRGVAILTLCWCSVAVAVGDLLVRVGTWLQGRKVPAAP